MNLPVKCKMSIAINFPPPPHLASLTKEKFPKSCKIKFISRSIGWSFIHPFVLVSYTCMHNLYAQPPSNFIHQPSRYTFLNPLPSHSHSRDRCTVPAYRYRYGRYRLQYIPNCQDSLELPSKLSLSRIQLRSQQQQTLQS